jgi:S-adenosyl-L-methionine hydrolase (adenosine-forming)
VIVFASDFGAGSEWVGVCHAVMATIAPQSRILDLTHTLPRFDVSGAGMILREALPYTPVSAAALVVDPGVGTERRAIVLRAARGDVLVGPDNGLLPLAAERIGGTAAAAVIDTARFQLPSTSTTFHARDVFCPVAARISSGTPFEELGTPIDVATLVRARPMLLEVGPGRIVCEATHVDGFGNVRLSARPESFAEAGLDGEEAVWVLTPSGELSAHRAPTFAALDSNRVGLILDSFGWFALCINRGSAADRLGVQRGSRIELRSRA